MDTMSSAEGNVGVAFGLVCGAGAATALGASVVFFPSLVKLASRRILAASLGLSAGVMIYVSFAEIFIKSVDGFADYLKVDEEGIDEAEVERREDMAYIYATCSFFGGVLSMLILDLLVRYFSGDLRRKHNKDDTSNIIQNNKDDTSIALSNKEADVNDGGEEQQLCSPHCVGCSDDPVRELNEWHELAEKEIQDRVAAEETKGGDTNTSFADGTGSGGTNLKEDNSSDGNNSGHSDSFKDNQTLKKETDRLTESGNKVVVENTPSDTDREAELEQKKLVKMGFNTAIAIALHNFPEGLATFVAALDDPSVGAVLAIAIGIHNIPEGLCVALPIYYATGNRWKAFMWGCLSGISEPIAALLGWAVLANAVTDDVYAILFGLVSGMMVIISLKELIPTAHRYDPDDSVVTYSTIGGMVIIALSLVLFKV